MKRIVLTAAVTGVAAMVSRFIWKKKAITDTPEEETTVEWILTVPCHEIDRYSAEPNISERKLKRLIEKAGGTYISRGSTHDVGDKIETYFVFEGSKAVADAITAKKSGFKVRERDVSTVPHPCDISDMWDAPICIHSNNYRGGCIIEGHCKRGIW
jgi:hypothetical protein